MRFLALWNELENFVSDNIVVRRGSFEFVVWITSRIWRWIAFNWCLIPSHVKFSNKRSNLKLLSINLITILLHTTCNTKEVSAHVNVFIIQNAILFQARGMQFVRAVSMEQRWQDLASLLSLPPADGGGIHHHFGHHHPLHNYGHSHTMGYGVESTRGVLLHNASLAPPMGDLNSTVPLGNLGNF